MKIGFVGQGFIGKNYANDFENRGYSVVRYALESEYVGNKERINECDFVFIAVPTPTTPEGFDFRIVDEAISLVGDGKVAIIKSTLLPGTTKKLQDKQQDKLVLFSPEFLAEATAAYDTAHPMFNIVGLPYDSPGHRRVAEKIMQALPQCDHNFIIRAHAAELFKYTHNIHGYMRVVFSNLLYDTASALGADWAEVKPIMDVDPMMSPWYNSPIHKTGRGAGGNCFVKDMAAFRSLYEELLSHDSKGLEVLKAMEDKNLELLKNSNKDQHLVDGVYGTSALAEQKPTVPATQTNTSLENVLAELKRREAEQQKKSELQD